MIGSSKNNKENYPRKCFWTQEKETRLKFNPELSANRPSNNWALTYGVRFDLSFQNFKNSLVDIFSPQIERKKRCVIILAV